MTTFSLLFSSPFSWLPCAISPPCKFASLALKRPYFLWARSSTPKILRYGCCNVNQKMHIGNQGANSGFILSLRYAALFLSLRFCFALRCAARRASGRKEVSAFTRTHRYGFAYARLHGGLTSGRAYGARSMGRLEMRGPADAISHVCEMRCGCWYSRFLAALGMTIAEIP
jgi:hypothetical protein